MSDINFDSAAAKLGMTRNGFDKLVKNGKEIAFRRSGRQYVVNEAELDAWLELRKARKIELSKEDFLRAVKFALKINYTEHTRSDFGTVRQRPFMQAVENWTQGALAEIALQKFIKDKFDAELQIEFRVFNDAVIGQDIVGIKRGRTINPPKKRVSVKSGKSNGMFLIVPVNEVETDSRHSDMYVFVRVIFPIDIMARFYRSSPDFSDMLDTIPEFQNVTAYITGYCSKDQLEKRVLPEAGINEEKYNRCTGQLRNSDSDWREFVDSI